MKALLLSLALLALAQEANAAPELTSFYVPGDDGTELAVDVWREPNATPERIPAIVQFTRYWRGFRGGGPLDPRMVEAFTSAGYAVVIADVRGTGASFGARTTEFSDAEISDYGAVFEWIIAQEWSNGRLATMGSSYLGNSAELSAITRHPALRAIVPRFSDFSEYRHAILPGGVRNSVIAVAWPSFVAALDRNDPCAAFANAPTPDCAPGAPWAGGVRPVQNREADLARAVAQHANNADIGRIAAVIAYSDDSFDRDGARAVTLDAVSPIGRWRAIEAARVPAYHWASWFDGGTAEGVLARYGRHRGPMRVVIGAWTHGGGRRADPFAEPDTAADPGPAEQLADIIAFLDPLLKEGALPETVTREIRYFTLGVNQWRTTPVWPPRGVGGDRYYLGADNLLTRTPSAGNDEYEIDFTATTGVLNRWHTQLGAAVDYGDRASEDAKLLVYTGAPLQTALEITGAPTARIALWPNQTDGALFVYLEAVLPSGRVIHLSDANRRLRFRDRDTRFTRREARSVRAGEKLVIELTLSPVSVELQPGTRLRVSIAGADADTFERLPPNGEALHYRIARASSFITVPTRPAV